MVASSRVIKSEGRPNRVGKSSPPISEDSIEIRPEPSLVRGEMNEQWVALLADVCALKAQHLIYHQEGMSALDRRLADASLNCGTARSAAAQIRATRD